MIVPFEDSEILTSDRNISKFDRFIEIFT